MDRKTERWNICFGCSL